jgi:hypothetical protein
MMREIGKEVALAWERQRVEEEEEEGLVVVVVGMMHRVFHLCFHA